jgi:hypothetical protein
MAKNSRQKGKRGELLWCRELGAMGFPGRRGQQFRGGGDSPDVVCDALPNLHAEVKNGVTGMDLGTKLLSDACSQAREECGDRRWYVAWKPNNKVWRVTYLCPQTFVLATVTGDDIKDALTRLNAAGRYAPPESA